MGTLIGRDFTFKVGLIGFYIGYLVSELRSFIAGSLVVYVGDGLGVFFYGYLSYLGRVVIKFGAYGLGLELTSFDLSFLGGTSGLLIDLIAYRGDIMRVIVECTIDAYLSRDGSYTY